MSLVTPELGLFFWSLLALIALGLPIAAFIVMLSNTSQDSKAKAIWSFVIIFIPFFGSILYLTGGRKMKTVDNTK